MGLVEPDGEGDVEEPGQVLPVLQADGAQLNIQLSVNPLMHGQFSDPYLKVL